MSHPIRPLSSLQSAVFLINSCSHHFTATTISLGSKSHHQQRRTFSRSYGTILPSSFTRVLSSALVFSTRPPVSVWGTIRIYLKLRGFSLEAEYQQLHHRSDSSSALSLGNPDLPESPAYSLKHGQPTPCLPNFLRLPIAIKCQYRNINLFPIDYASRPRLRGRLTLPRLTLDRNPWSFGVEVFHPHYRYSCQHSHF